METICKKWVSETNFFIAGWRCFHDIEGCTENLLQATAIPSPGKSHHQGLPHRRRCLLICVKINFCWMQYHRNQNCDQYCVPQKSKLWPSSWNHFFIVKNTIRPTCWNHFFIVKKKTPNPHTVKKKIKLWPSSWNHFFIVKNTLRPTCWNHFCIVKKKFQSIHFKKKKLWPTS